jgi:small-conductance mechanosensitive channel
MRIGTLQSRLGLLLLVAEMPHASLAAAQDSASTQAIEQPTAPVVLDGLTLFQLRGISAFPAERRAEEIAARIGALAADRTVPAESLVVRESDFGTSIVAGGRRVLTLVDADAALEGVSRQVLAQAYRDRLVEAVRQYRRDREPEVLWGAAVRTLAATAALACALWLLVRFLRRFRSLLERRYRSRLHDVQIRSVQVVRAEQVWLGVRRTVGAAAALTALVALYIYLGYVLLLFPWTRGLGQSLSTILLQPLATIGTGILRYVPNVVFLVILALLTRYVLGLARLIFSHIADGTLVVSWLERDWAQPVDRIIRILVIAFALVVAYPYIPGSGSEAFKGISLVLGLLISIGSPSVLGNIVAGQSLAFRRAFKVGDRIKIGEHVGEVAQIRLLTTSLRSPKNEQIVIPNGLILSHEVVNYSALASTPGLILHTTVGIGYETPWRQVHAMLLEAAARTPGLLTQPEPFVLQPSLGDFAVVYEINAYADNPRAIPRMYSALHANILDVFNEFGVQIMTPAYEGDPATPKLVPRAEWFAAPAQAPDGARPSSPAPALTAPPSRPA